jgi:3-dehydroquinate dehydratase I
LVEVNVKDKICLSIGNVDYPTVLEVLSIASLVELRLDLLNLSNSQLKEVFSIHSNAIATCRAKDNNHKEAIKTLSDAIDLGCAYIDVDINTPEMWLKPLVNRAKELNRKVILSYHNHTCTPAVTELDNVIEKMFGLEPSYVKIACFANCEADLLTMLGLYARYQKIIALSMGTLGKISRLVAPTLGAPFTYASYKGYETAPGQIDFHEVDFFLNNYFSK